MHNPAVRLWLKRTFSTARRRFSAGACTGAGPWCGAIPGRNDSVEGGWPFEGRSGEHGGSAKPFQLVRDLGRTGERGDCSYGDRPNGNLFIAIVLSATAAGF